MTETEAKAQAMIGQIKSELVGKNPTELKMALRKLQLRWHPDKNLGNESTASIVFQFIQKQWDRLVS